jgi:hypothetical protein
METNFKNATVGSTLTINRMGQIFQVIVNHASKVQIDISYLKYYGEDLGWREAHLSFAPNGKVKYLKEDTKIISLDIIE